MKSKVLPLLTGVVALTLSIVSAIPVFAQSAPTTPQTQSTHARRHQNFLNLTADQKVQMKQVHQTERTAIDTILTADQKAQLKAERQNHTGRTGEQKGKRHSPFASLNLSADQKTQIETARRTARQQTDAILTPEQKAQRQQHMEQHRQNEQAAPQAK